MRSYVMEGIGSFFLVLAVGVSGDPYTIGITVAAATYAGLGFSGAHYNPAVSIALWVHGYLSSDKLIPFISAQLFGGFIASIHVFWLTGRTFGPAPAPTVGSFQAIFLECLFTLLLILVFLSLKNKEKSNWNPATGAAVGFTYCASAMLIGPFSGSAINPAVGLGPLLIEALLGNSHLDYLWIYVAGPLLGTILGVTVISNQKKEEKNS